MKKTFRIFKILIFVLILLGVFQVIVSNQLANAGEKLTQIEEEIKILEEKNEGLKKEIAVSSSLTTIAEKAEEIGFLRSENFLYLTDEPFALKNSY